MTSCEDVHDPWVVDGHETILVAEDNEVARNVLTETLRVVGYTVFEAVDGEEALQIFHENGDKIDMCIFDVVMPKIAGPEVHAKITLENAEIPVLFISGHGQDIMEAFMKAKDSADLLLKPYNPTDLLAKVREVLDRPKQEPN